MQDKIYRLLKIKYTMQSIDIKPDTYEKTIVFIHGLGNSNAVWKSIIESLSDEERKYRLIAVDLIGFGESKRPNWIKYNLNYQATALRKTLRRLQVRGPVILIGHSLGSLISIEYAKIYKSRVSNLILCSPPIYKNETINNKAVIKTADEFLKNIYSRAYTRQESFLRLTKIAKKYKLLDERFSLDETNIKSYMTTLSASIINQTSFEDAISLNKPTLIVRGILDPFVIGKNLKELSKLNPNITIKNIPAGHDIKGKYIKTIVQAIKDM